MAPYGKAEELFATEEPLSVLQSIADIHLFPLLVETALLAVFSVQTIYFVYHRCSRDDKALQSGTTHAHHHYRGPHINVMLCIHICIYIFAVAYWALDVAILQQELLVFFPKLLSGPPNIDAFQTLTNMLGVQWYAQAVLQGFIWIASDGVALWRAYAVHGRPRWLGIIICLLALTELGVYTQYLVFYLHILPSPPHSIAREHETGDTVVAPYLAAASFTIAVQIFATSVIACKAWMVWKSRKDLFNGPGRVFRTLALLIESGVTYTLFWVWYILARNDSIVSWKMATWTEYYSIPLMAMYPTLVVMVVTMQNSALTADDNLPNTHPRPSSIMIDEKLD
ncbi:unnamed protein product [Peniophora sp. CBMAI 1063]|nr:unnamed protein product [Peniophora sp. CBMAI 1063]